MAHAILSASGAHRWLNCTPSARLELEFDETAGEAALEGTAAHELAEHKLRKALKMRSKKPTSSYDSDEMDLHTESYVEFILEQIEVAKASCADPLVLIEQRLDFSEFVPEGFGTGDCVIVADGTLHVIDFKYGLGVLVESKDNPQMMLYGLGALGLFDAIYDIETIAMTIYQPRRENISTHTMSKDALLSWAGDTLKPKADLAFAGEGLYVPGDWCRFCRAAVKCRARSEEKMKMARFDFKKPPLLSDEEIGEILLAIGDLTKWADSIMAYAQSIAINQGKEWPGFKLVEGRSNRKYTDEEAVAQAAKKAGYKDIYQHKLIPITEMEKLLGKEQFKTILGIYIIKPPGKFSLVPIEDKRNASNTAKSDFMEEI